MRRYLLIMLCLVVTGCSAGRGGTPPDAEGAVQTSPLPQSNPSSRDAARAVTPHPQDGVGETASALERLRVEPVARPVLLGSDTFISEPGTYVVEVSSRHTWQVGMVGERITWSPVGDAFATFGDGGLIVVRWAEGPAVRLYEGHVAAVAWSSDGRRIAFTVSSGNPGSESLQDGLYVVDRDGGHLTRLSEEKGINGILWQSNGDHLVLLTVSGYAYLFDPNSKQMTRLPGTLTRDLVAWSPDGRRLAVGNPEGLMIFDSGTGDKWRVSDRPANRFVAWSPNGKAVLTGEAISGLSRSIVLSWIDSVKGADGWPLAVAFGNPTWDPSARRFGYVEDGCTSGTFDLHTTTADRVRTRVTKSEHLKLRPLWSPLGSYIVFSSGNALMLADVTAPDERVLLKRSTTLPDPLLPISWSPDGRFLAFYVADGSGVCD